MLQARVKAGQLPPVDRRLPQDPLVVVPPQQIGPYGGTWARFVTTTSDVNFTYWYSTYPALVRWDPTGQKLLPNLARGWEISKDTRTYTIYLRKGVRWSDGQPFTADDIMFWYEDIIQNPQVTDVIPSALKRGGELVKLEKLDDYTLQFSFKEPYGLFLEALAYSLDTTIARCPKHYLKQFHPRYVPIDRLEEMARQRGFNVWFRLFRDRREDWKNADLPRLSAWVPKYPPPARPIIFERNPYYWKVDPQGNQLPYIDRLSFQIFDHETIYMKLVNGEMGLQARRVYFDKYPLLMENRKKGRYRVLKWPMSYGGWCNIALNLNHKDPVLHKIFNDRRFRIAMSHAIDRDEINDVIFYGAGEPRQCGPMKGSPYYTQAAKEYERAYIEHDPDLAGRLLDEMGLKRPAGDPDGVRLRPDGKPLRLFIDTIGRWTAICQLVADHWSAVGVKTDVKVLARELCRRRAHGLMHDAIVWAGADEQMPIVEPRWFFPYNRWSYQAVDYGRWFDSDGQIGQVPPPEIRRCMDLYRQIKRTSDQDERIKLFDEILELNRRNLWVIGTIGQLPQLVVVKDTFRTVPQVAVYGNIFRAIGATAPECYAIQED